MTQIEIVSNRLKKSLPDDKTMHQNIQEQDSRFLKKKEGAWIKKDFIKYVVVFN